MDANSSSCAVETIAVKQEPASSSATEKSLPYDDDDFVGTALLDSLRNVPDPMIGSSPRGKKNPIVTLDSIKKELHFECELCGKRFRKSVDCIQHKLSHGEPLNCDMCSERFFKPWDLNKHQMEKHSDSPMPKCKICSKTFIEHWRLLRHLRTHSKVKKFKCDLCGKTFSESGNLAKHTKQVHTKDRPYKCDLCDKSYPQKKDLQGHMLVHTTKRFSCSYCKEEFALVEDKRAHVKSLHKHEAVARTFSCTVCDATFNSKAKFIDHSLTHGERRFECKFCMKKFHTTTRVRKHMRSHQVEQHSKCEICDKSFSQDCNMKRHIEFMHMRDDRYICLHCPSTFALPSELRAHRDSEHQNELPYKCSFCEKAFSHHQSLANHSKCHRNPKRHLKEFIKPVSRRRRVSKKQKDAIDPSSPQSSESKHDETTNESSYTKDGNEELVVPMIVKRRGRPRKNIAQSSESKHDEASKESSNTKDGDEELIVPMIAKRRGRPRKNIPAATISTPSSIATVEIATGGSELDQRDECELVPDIKVEGQDVIEIGPTQIQDN